MAGPDIVLFVVGALLFAGAGYALVLQGEDAFGGGSPTGLFTLSYATQEVEVGTQPVPNMASGTATFDVDQTDIGKVVVTVACGDAVPGGTFQLQVRVEAPAGIAVDPKAGSCGAPIVFDVPIADAPPGGTLQGSNEAEAREDIAPTENATAGQGAWTVTVTGARGGQLPALPAGNPSGSIVLSIERWEPTLTAVPR